MFVIQNTMLTIRETEALKAFQKQGSLSSANDYDGYGRTGEIKSLTDAELIHHVNASHDSAYFRYELTKKGQEMIEELLNSISEPKKSKKDIKFEGASSDQLIEDEVVESEESRKKRAKQHIDKEIKRLEKEAMDRATKEKEQLEVAQKKQIKKKKDL